MKPVFILSVITKTEEFPLVIRFGSSKKQYLEPSCDIFNLASVFNKEWDTSKLLGKQNIYSLGGFDPASATYLYVNVNSGVVVPGGNPRQIQLGLRYGF